MPAPVTSVTVNGITGTILTEAPFGWGNGPSGPARHVTYLVNDTGAGEAVTFADGLIGIGVSGSSIFTWPAPHRYPGNVNIFCNQVSLHDHLEGRFADYQLMTSTSVAITAHYGTGSQSGRNEVALDPYGDDNMQFFDDVRIPWASLTQRGGYEEHRARDLTSEVTGAVISDSVKVRVPTIDYLFRRSMIPSLYNFDTTLSNLAGKANSDVFFRKAIGTVRLDSWDQDDEWDSSGKRMRTFSMQLKWRVIEWNKVLEPGSARTWVYASDSTGNRPYVLTAFAGLKTYGLV